VIWEAAVFAAAHAQESAMNSTDPTTMNLLAVFILVLIAVIGAVIYQRTKSRKLEEHFGDEYHRTVDSLGSRSKAERELEERRKRVEKLNIVPLSPDEAARFGQAWRHLQSQFIDNPKGVLADADRLVRELMLKRGYPMGDFERRAADISVDHPQVVDHYRAAQAVALRDRNGQADTEDLRKAVVHYRALFEELLEVTPTTQPTSSTPATVRT
jgi:hypothetical protein